METNNNKGGLHYLAKNVGLLTISNFGTRLLTFFLVPLYTAILSTEDYGNYDLIHTTVQLLIPFFTLKIDEAVMRFALDKTRDKSNIFTVGLKYTVLGTLGIGILTYINHLLGVFDIIDRFAVLFVILYFLSAFSNLMIMFVRGLERVSDVAVSGVISSTVIIVCNILFLLPLHMGLLGYFLASILGVLASSLYLFIRPKCWRYIKKPIDKAEQSEMVKYAAPMIANSVSWWVNNASDRYIVTWLCGVAANGIYSVAYKIPSILSVLHNIFLQAWTISAVKDFDPEDKDGFFSNLYNTYNFLMVASCSALIILDKPLARFLYANEFYEAWKYVPFLLISIVFLALSGYMGGIFSAVKNSKMYAFTTTAGAIVNTILNLVLVYFVGALGASIATAIGFFTVWLLRIVQLKKYIHLKIKIMRDSISYLILVIQSVVLITNMGNALTVYTIQAVLFLTILIMFRKEIKIAGNKVISMVKRKVA